MFHAAADLSSATLLFDFHLIEALYDFDYQFLPLISSRNLTHHLHVRRNSYSIMQIP